MSTESPTREERLRDLSRAVEQARSFGKTHQVLIAVHDGTEQGPVEVIIRNVDGTCAPSINISELADKDRQRLSSLLANTMANEYGIMLSAAQDILTSLTNEATSQ